MRQMVPQFASRFAEPASQLAPAKLIDAGASNMTYTDKSSLQMASLPFNTFNSILGAMAVLHCQQQ